MISIEQLQIMCISAWLCSPQHLVDFLSTLTDFPFIAYSTATHRITVFNFVVSYCLLSFLVWLKMFFVFFNISSMMSSTCALSPLCMRNMITLKTNVSYSYRLIWLNQTSSGFSFFFAVHPSFLSPHFFKSCHTSFLFL